MKPEEIQLAQERAQIGLRRAITAFAEKQTGRELKTAKDVAVFALEDVRKKSGALRHLQLLCVAQCLIKGNITCADIGATEAETEELQKIMSGA